MLILLHLAITVYTSADVGIGISFSTVATNPLFPIK